MLRAGEVGWGSWASWVLEEKVVGASQTGAGRGQEKRERRDGSGAQAGSGMEQLISYLGDQIDLLYIYCVIFHLIIKCSDMGGTMLL